MAKRMLRSEVPLEQTWRIEDIFPSLTEFDAELAAVERDIPSVAQYRGKLGEGAATFLACLEANEALERRLAKVGTYAFLRISADGSASENQMASGRVASLRAKVAAATAFIRSESLALPAGTLERYLSEEPGLASFRRLVERMIEEKPHMLSQETEVALASLGEVLGAPATIYERARSTDMTFRPVRDGAGNELPMSFPVYEEGYERSSDTTLRRNAFRSFTDGLKAYQNTFAATFATEVKKNIVTAKLRGYKDATDMLLARQEVPREVYNSLHDIILGELAPHMRRYVELRKRVLGLDKILYCDIEAPLDPDYSPSISFAEAADLILGGVKVMGPDYTEINRRALEDRWVDWSDNVGKVSGCFTASVWGVHPYILVTWANTGRNVFFLAHEIGHAVHGVYTQRHQRPSNGRASMFFIEAPSTINEILVAQHLLSETIDVRRRRWLIMQMLGTYYHNFVRHLIEGELQRRIYVIAEQGQTITASTLSRVQGEILAEFWGDLVEIDDGARLTWMRQSHYYSGLYPYSYSAGLTCGTAVAQDIREQGQPAIDRWIRVLEAGGTKKPLELMAMAGVDMTKPDPIRKAVNYVGTLIDEVVKSF
ncbi:MAG: oligoendopeptidase F [Chloroflexota bacterium]